MTLRRTIGISLALMMISAGASAKTSNERADHLRAHAAKPEGSRSRPGRARARHLRHRIAQPRHIRHEWRHHAHSGHHRLAATHPRRPDRYIGANHAPARAEIGKAAWYDLDGRRTASGERFDGNVLSAAHRTLPLRSYAKVTDLDNGRSVVVKINDRGPWNRWLIIDLSKRAAAVLGMRHAGIARVTVEPLGYEPPAAEPAPQVAAGQAAPI